MAVVRPARSDAHLTLEEEAKIEAEARECFEEVAPKRHTKPQRSDYSSDYNDALETSDPNATIPELSKFQDLESDSQKLTYTAIEATEEYVETDYYKDLNYVDKQHHTTGTGFIKVENANDSYLSLAPDSDSFDCHASCKGNPATNEWIPAADTVIPPSDKPNRSDN
ncbi:uncharacterized protein LOC131252648 isoform X1 [Magnolia sinica]|uniref:uncharacterized protein LOC131252648 isoform X1 n=1 Tax=Magnolia sinica TaxID=86752 RepID=UPI00265A2107|nr:uncharacterized protein LOC131252648 isoform X1 [Magnolia sinica]